MDYSSEENISLDQSADRWDVFYEELCRRIDHQIAENARLEDQALFILRIILATIGLILTAFSVLASTGNIGSVSSTLDSADLSSIATEIVTTLPHFDENQSELVALILATIIIGYFIRCVFYLFIQVPRYSYKVLQPTVLEPSSAAPKMEVYYKEGLELENIKHSIIDEYTDLAESNRNKIESTRSSWEDCYRAIRIGTISFGISFLFLIAITIVRNANVILALLVLFSWVNMRKLDISELKGSLRGLAVYDLKVDFSTVALIITGYLQAPGTPVLLLSQENWQFVYLVAMMLTSLSIVFYTRDAEYDRIEKYAKRTYAISMVLLLITVVITAGTSLEYQQNISYLGDLLIISFIIYIIEALIIMAMIPIWKAINYMSRVVSESNLPKYYE